MLWPNSPAGQHDHPPFEPTPDPGPCDHEWEYEDESFDHEFGTEVQITKECKLCGQRFNATHERFDDPFEEPYP